MTCLSNFKSPSLSLNHAPIRMVLPHPCPVSPAQVKPSSPDCPNLTFQKGAQPLTGPWRTNDLLYESISCGSLFNSLGHCLLTPFGVGTKHEVQTGGLFKVSEGTDLGLDSSPATSVWCDPGRVTVLYLCQYLFRETTSLLLGHSPPPQLCGYPLLPCGRP